MSEYAVLHVRLRGSEQKLVFATFEDADDFKFLCDFCSEEDLYSIADNKITLLEKMPEDGVVEIDKEAFLEMCQRACDSLGIEAKGGDDADAYAHMKFEEGITLQRLVA